jgi:hypothetical protein
MMHFVLFQSAQRLLEAALEIGHLGFTAPEELRERLAGLSRT